MDQEYIQTINTELARINCPQLQFHPEQARVSIQTEPNRTSWPHPIGLEELSRVLTYLPTDASVKDVSAQLGMYSLGWHGGRERMLQNEDIKAAYYKEQGIGTQETDKPAPTLGDVNDLPPAAPGPDDLVPREWGL